MSNQYIDMLRQPHLLVAGTTGSGKSTLLNTLMYTALEYNPQQVQFILLDPKGCELVDYAKLPHTLMHCTSLQDILPALKYSVNLMDNRFTEMKKKNQKESDHVHTYVVIDEYIDIKLQLGKVAESLLIRLIAKGRAARIHVILCTQRPTRDIINGAIVANFPAKVALRCNSKQESRNIIDTGGAELLPTYGEAIYRVPQYKELIHIQINQTPLNSIKEKVDCWINSEEWRWVQKKRNKKRVNININIKSLVLILIVSVLLFCIWFIL